MIIENWKLKEVFEQVTILDDSASSFTQDKLQQFGFPEKYNEGLDRSETHIDWDKISEHHAFFFDYEDSEDPIKKLFENSDLAGYEYLIITYDQDELVVKVPFSIFLDDWEGFVRSTLYNALIFSDDFKLVLEVSRDYYFHSNFKIN